MVSVAQPASGPDLPERVELVRAALPEADLPRFEQDLDQAPLDVEDAITRYLT